MALKRVKYVGRSTGREIEHPPGRWIEVPNGGTVDLPTRLAESLAEQTDQWVIVDVKQKAADAVKDGEG
jgi:hypothetical protein